MISDWGIFWFRLCFGLTLETISSNWKKVQLAKLDFKKLKLKKENKK